MKRRAGITLIELLISLALISFIIVSGINLFLFGTRAQGKSLDEFNVQSNVRVVSQNVNSIIRDSSAVFLMNKEYPDSLTNIETYLTEGWNYLMLNEDKTQLIEWVWDGSNHVQRVVIDKFKDVSYDLTYNRESDANEDRLLGFTLDIDVKGKKRTITSELEGVNTLQIIDRSYGGIASTLAYRSDSRLTDIAIAQAAVSFVVDQSGSMENTLGDSTRIAVLKDEATNMIEGLADYENVWLSISPFSTTANSISNADTNKMLNLKSNINTFINNDNSVIKKLSADGGTNTGDGMRRGLSTIIKFNEEDDNQDKITKNFMIILVDGDTTFATATERVNRYYSETNRNKQHEGTITLNADTENERIYIHNLTTRSTDWWNGYYKYTHRYLYNGSDHTTYYTALHENVDDFSGTNNINNGPYFGLSENIYVPKGKVVGNGRSYDTNFGKPYVNLIGKMINDYRSSRDDGIEVFIIGFSSSATTIGLQDLANATKATQGTHGDQYKYYKADTAEALETVLNEIKFQISDALWHIGGPN